MSKVPEMETLMSQRNYTAALNLGLGELSNKQEFKDKEKTLQTVVKSMGYIKDTEISKFVAELDPNKYDAMMKLIYTGLAEPTPKSASLLKWHAAVYEKGGLGCITRVLTTK